MNAPSSKHNIVTPFQTETYWIDNPFVSHTPCLLLIIKSNFLKWEWIHIYMCKWEFSPNSKHTAGRLLSKHWGLLFFLTDKTGSKQRCDHVTVIYIFFNSPRSKYHCRLYYREHDGSQFALCSLWTSKIRTLSSLVAAICIITLLPNPNHAFWLRAMARSVISLEYAEFFPPLDGLLMLYV